MSDSLGPRYQGKIREWALNALMLAIITLVSVEALSFVYCRFIEPNVPRPAYAWRGPESAYWGDINRDFGVWRYPDVKGYLHKKECFRAVLSSNSVGARDVERKVDGPQERVVALGDSFIEGFGLNDNERLTNLLEKSLSREVMNFGCSGVFGPLQYLLVYKTIAKKFSHSAVLVGVLPDNDFFDMDLETGKRMYSDRYRPYLVGKYPDYRIIYKGDFDESRGYMNTPVDKARKFLRSFTHFYNVYEYVKLLYKSMRAQAKAARGEREKVPEAVYSGYYDFTEEQYDTLRWCLERIVEEAQGRKVVVVTLPRLNDFIRYGKGQPRLPERLKNLGREKGFEYVDLLPAMYRLDGNYEEYFFSCDRHWSPVGSAQAAKALSGPLGEILDGMRQEGSR